jgi:hypothetical protein
MKSPSQRQRRNVRANANNYMSGIAQGVVTPLAPDVSGDGDSIRA